MELDAILNWTIPALVVIFFVGIFYVKLKEPIDTILILIGRGIRGIFLRGRDASESVNVEDIITY